MVTQGAIMMKILTAAALTIGSPLILLAVCYAVSYIPIVKQKFDVGCNDSFFMKVSSGFLAIAICIIILSIPVLLFSVFYGLL